VDNSINKKKIFISYAHEDAEAAKSLFNDLNEFDDINNPYLDLFLDKESLLPGQNWRKIIETELKDSHYFIILLSNNSIEQNRYVQEELKIAKDLSKERPDSQIYIIPIRLDDCQIPESLQNLHIVDLFPDRKKSFTNVLKALEIGKPKKLDISHWENLLSAIEQQNCIPFIGDSALEFFNQADDEYFLTSKEIARVWAKQYEYPIEGVYELPKVAQYLALKEGTENHPKTTFSNRLKRLKLPDFRTEKYKASPHAILADLNLPLFITTNYDHLLEEALRVRGRKPVSQFCNWNDQLRNAAEMGMVPPLFKQDPTYEPTIERPLIFHFHGSIEYPPSMVLTERDYFEFVINMNREADRDILPKNIRTALTLSSLLFIGYQLEDTDFRSIFQGGLSFMSSVPRTRTSIAVLQINIPSIANDKVKKRRIVKYLENYTFNMFKIIVYWGNSEEFIEELRVNWKSFINNGTITNV
jgi:hypothetical protein